MSFYYPLTLGVRRPTPVDTKLDERPPHQSYETWREGVERDASVYEEFPEARVLERLQQRARWRKNRLWLVLGEPGAGKTTLLEVWFTRWAAQLATARLGLVVPMLVRLRSVQVEQIPQDSDEFADQLWALGLSEQALLEGQGESIYRLDRRRCFQPVWLFDGLDELSPPPGERFYQALVNLPGLKVLSCRTAVYEIFRREVDRYKEQEYELLGLRSADQHVFLTHALNGDAQRAKVLHHRLQHNSQLRLLAGNPLMLSLIAQVSDPMALPTTRSAFYQAAVSELWRRRLARHPDADFRTRERDQVLTELAERMGMAQIQAPLAWLEEAANHVAGPDGRSLMRYLHHAGIVRPHSREKVEFVHLTFQEFYLAQALRQGTFQKVLEHYWHNPRYEETLGLLIAMLYQTQQFEDIDQGLRWLVEWGEATHRRTPAMLWQQRRSPLRVALHLLHRAGVALEYLPHTADFLWEQLNHAPRRWFWGTQNRSAWRKFAAAVDAKTPPHILNKLAQDADEHVRRGVAHNPSTPPEALARLAQDADEDVRWDVAQHRSAPPEALARLAQDADEHVRRSVAHNPSTPPEALARLAQETNKYVRWGVASSSSTPPELLMQLAEDAAGEVRWGVAHNPSAPPEALARLAQDADEHVRRDLARNPSTPPEALARLAQDGDARVRSGVAINSSTPPELLMQLAQEANMNVRWGVARNHSAPPELLMQLAEDEDARVRRDLALNSSLPPEALARLAQDATGEVRWGVAFNSSTPPELLMQLAKDPDRGVRRGVAHNPSTPPEALARLAQDADEDVRRSAADNPSTPPEALARLAQDANEDVRRSAAENPGTLLEDL